MGHYAYDIGGWNDWRLLFTPNKVPPYKIPDFHNPDPTDPIWGHAAEQILFGCIYPDCDGT